MRAEPINSFQVNKPVLMLHAILQLWVAASGFHTPYQAVGRHGTYLLDVFFVMRDKLLLGTKHVPFLWSCFPGMVTREAL